MSDNKTLPSSWTTALLGEVCDKPEYGWTTSASQTGTIKFLRTTDISRGEIDWDSVPFCKYNPTDIDQYLLKTNDIVISRAGSVGLSALIHKSPPAVFASYLIRFRPSEIIEAAYIYYFLKSPDYWRQIVDRSVGIALSNVNARKLESISLALPPFKEQRRIIAEIENHFVRLDQGMAALRRLKGDLPLYRASVFKAACDGSLVPREAVVARLERREYEPAGRLLERILKLRRTKWEREQLGKMRAQNKRPKNSEWKERYVEPEEPSIGHLPELPEGWAWATVEQISTKVVDGVHKKPNYLKEGIPFVTVRNLTASSSLSFERVKHISLQDHSEFILRANPERGDLLISKDGTLGVIRLVRTKTVFSIFVSVALVKPVVHNSGDFLEIALSSPQVQAQMVPKGSGLQHIHLEDLKADCLPLPPHAEQKRIVAEVNKRLRLVEDVERTVTDSLARAEELRRSILQRAFAGCLVLQDPTDEPASDLLLRITTERQRKTEEVMKAKKRKPPRKEAKTTAKVSHQTEDKNLLKAFRGRKGPLPIEAAFERAGYSFAPNDEGEYADVDAFFVQLSELLTKTSIAFDRESDQVILRRAAR